jgi:hypothetical protein
VTERHRGVKLLLRLALLCLLPVAVGCTGTRTYARGTLAPLSDVYACAVHQLGQLGYELALQDSVGGLAQGRRQITGLVETARRGAARATRVITGGLAGGSRDRYDELTISVYRRRYPQGNTIEATAGMLVVAGETDEREEPTDQAIADARTLIDACAPRF